MNMKVDIDWNLFRGTSPMINIEDALQRMHQAEKIGEVKFRFNRKKNSLFDSRIWLYHSINKY